MEKEHDYVFSIRKIICPVVCPDHGYFCPQPWVVLLRCFGQALEDNASLFTRHLLSAASTTLSSGSPTACHVGLSSFSFLWSKLHCCLPAVEEWAYTVSYVCFVYDFQIYILVCVHGYIYLWQMQSSFQRLRLSVCAQACAEINKKAMAGILLGQGRTFGSWSLEV